MRTTILCGAMALLACGPALAQAPAKTEPVGQAALQRIVGDGVFELKQGKSIDLTKKEWLLTFKGEQNRDSLERSQITIMIAGYQHSMTPGQRHDFKGYSSTQKDAKDKDKCFLDLVDVVAPKGAPATATFRFSCL